jgi:hypothetical protein
LKTASETEEKFEKNYLEKYLLKEQVIEKLNVFIE